MRAAELAVASVEARSSGAPFISTTAEDWGWTDHLNGVIAEPLDGEPADSQWHAGWLAREIATHDVRETLDAAWAWDISRPIAEQLAETARDDAAADALVEGGDKPAQVTPETLTEQMVREAMALGDTPMTGNGFLRACEVTLGARGWGAYVPTSLNESFDAERRICDVINARSGGS